MKLKTLLFDFTLVFTIAFLVTGVVTLVWNLLVDGNAQVEWQSALRYALILGLVLPLAELLRQR